MIGKRRRRKNGQLTSAEKKGREKPLESVKRRKSSRVNCDATVEELNESIPLKNIPDAVDSALTQALRMMIVDTALESTLTFLQDQCIGKEVKPGLEYLPSNGIKLEPGLEIAEKKFHPIVAAEEVIDGSDVKPKFEPSEPTWPDGQQDVKPNIKFLQSKVHGENTSHKKTHKDRLNVFDFLQSCVADAPLEKGDTPSSISDPLHLHFSNLISGIERNSPLAQPAKDGQRGNLKKRGCPVKNHRKKKEVVMVTLTQADCLSVLEIDTCLNEQGAPDFIRDDCTLTSQGIAPPQIQPPAKRRQKSAAASSFERSKVHTAEAASFPLSHSNSSSDTTTCTEWERRDEGCPGQDTFTGNSIRNDKESEKDIEVLHEDHSKTRTHGNGVKGNRRSKEVSLKSTDNTEVSERGVKECDHQDTSRDTGRQNHMESGNKTKVLDGDHSMTRTLGNAVRGKQRRREVSFDTTDNTEVESNSNEANEHRGNGPKGSGTGLQICQICGKGFKKKKYLKIHIKRHSDVKPFECKVCGKKFRDKHQLFAHNVTHSEERNFKCEICNKVYKRENNLKRHMIDHNGKRSILCPVCGKAFKEMYAMMRHHRVHTREKPYKCDTCGKRYREKNVLNEHIRTHSGEKPYSCDICGKAFSRYGEIKQHRKIHTGEKRYSCDMCGKAFARLNHIQIHVLIHTGVKPQKCEICGLRFRQVSVLIAHRKSHVQQRPFQCEVCSHSFRTESDLAQHKRRHTGEKPFKCTLCSKRFCQVRSLYHHKSRHHKDEIQKR